MKEIKTKATVYRLAAKGLLDSSEIRVDDRAEVQVVRDGAFVQAWVWMANDNLSEVHQKDLDSLGG